MLTSFCAFQTAQLIATDAVDTISVYVHESGGILKASQNLSMAAAAGMSGLIGAMPELGIGTAAHIHIALAASHLPHDSDCCGSIYWLEDFIVEPLKIEGGRFSAQSLLSVSGQLCRSLVTLAKSTDTVGFAYPPPGSVGLGVTVDSAAVQRWARNGPVDQSRPRPPITPLPFGPLVARM
eukprot:SAG31_NODE_12498_length_937_cov_0.811456_2_plen_180_part_00